MKKYFLILTMFCLVAFCGCRKKEIADNDSPSTPPSVSADDVEEEDFGSF